MHCRSKNPNDEVPMKVYRFAPESCGCASNTVICCPDSGGGSMGPMGPTGPTGPAGGGTASTYDASRASSYTQGQMVVMPDGTIYVVNKNNPSGTPGSSVDYTPIAGGSSSSSVFDPSKTGSYTQGKLVVYDGKIYVVNRNNPSGTPGSSSDYTEITGGQGSSARGATGPIGPFL